MKKIVFYGLSADCCLSYATEPGVYKNEPVREMGNAIRRAKFAPTHTAMTHVHVLKVDTAGDKKSLHTHSATKHSFQAGAY